MPHAQVQLMANTGHAAFWDDASGFNEMPARVLRDSVELSINGGPGARGPTEFGPVWTREPGDAWELFAREGRDQRGNIT